MKRLRVGAVIWNPVKPGTEFTPSDAWASVKVKTPNGTVTQYFDSEGRIVAETEE